MKRMFVTGIVALLGTVTTSAFAQMTDNTETGSVAKESRKEERAEKRNEVNYLTREGFSRDFPDIQDALYEKGRVFDEVSFINKGESEMAFYDSRGELVGTTTVKALEDLPQSAQNKIAKHYAGYTVDKVIMFDDNEFNDTDMWLYGEQFKDEDNYFVELSKPGKDVIVEVSMNGQVSFFKNL